MVSSHGFGNILIKWKRQNITVLHKIIFQYKTTYILLSEILLSARNIMILILIDLC